MQEQLIYIAELSKYFIVAIMSIYTVLGFALLSYKDNKPKEWLCNCQTVTIFVFQIISFYALWHNSGDNQYFFFYLFVQVFLILMLGFTLAIYENMNRILLNNMCMLMGIGLCMVSRLSFQKATKQYIIMILSLIISMFIPFIFSNVRFMKKLTWVYGIFGVSILTCVYVFGEVTKGSKLNITIEGITFQPSEFVKIIFLFFIAASLWNDTSLLQVFITAVVAGLYVIVLVISTDLGSAVIFFMGFLFVVFIATRNYFYLALGAGGGSFAAVIAYHLFSHVRIRVLAFQDPWSYIDKEGYQITQSLFAVGSGSWFGVGLFKGNPKAIPYVDADFIFSSLCEEYGAIVGICVILICINSFLVMMKMSCQIKDKFYQMIVYGIGVMYIFQVFLTIGGGIKFIPLTGVTLPFISYGGSSVMASMIMFFIVQGIYIRLQQEGGRARGKRKLEHGREGD